MDNQSRNREIAIIAGVFTVVAALIAGIFLIANTFLQYRLKSLDDSPTSTLVSPASKEKQSNENNCPSLSQAQIKDLETIKDVSKAIAEAENYAGHSQNDYVPGETIPAGVLIASNFYANEKEFQDIGILPVSSQGGWGLFISQKTIKAKYPGTYWCIVE